MMAMHAKNFAGIFAAVLIIGSILSGGVLADPPPVTANATAGAGTGANSADASGTPGAGSGQCDFTAIKASLSGTESGGNYSAICMNKGSECRGGARGKYQFIRATRSSYIKSNPQCNGSSCDSDSAWISAACQGVQECIMDAYLAESLDRLKKEPACQQLLQSGQTFTGSGQGKTLTCQPTESGLLGAMHLGGNGKSTCQRILSGKGGSSDELNTSLTYYMCKHGGKPVPGQCTPAPYDPQQSQPVATQPQIESMDELGIPQDDLGGDPDPLKNYWLTGLMMMAEQFTANMAMQVQGIGMLLDAKDQLETQRSMQRKAVEAHKDYHPSEQMCTFGTFSRDLVASERSANLTRNALSTDVMQRELGNGDTKGSSILSDSLSRIHQFRKRFCDQSDDANGLKNLCINQNPPKELVNADIDFTRTIDSKLSLDIKMTDQEVTPDEEAVFALIDNLFAHDPLPRVPTDLLERRNYEYQYMNLRSIVAMRGIARNSFASIIALKTATPNRDAQTAAPYMKALMRDFGLQDEEIKKLLGENPSYYAQMELLTKKMYQSPAFYTNLYDKPANVKRIRAAMKAVKLMQERDTQAALQRREMLMSMILEIRLREQADAVYDGARRAMFEKGE
ncbi:MAG: hypothetical protein DI626_01810 [Micavibrio aeruginosavorus]|uniref:Uncharacterized protein n=1 Tax=Micavibrio aeruginosavorus TaxID=349221 RepID=A0A2W5A1H7_9BACT|nr:MAG: hypothetical protein DI626_01810 [Micavibrio aeruginosavorus]